MGFVRNVWLHKCDRYSRSGSYLSTASLSEVISSGVNGPRPLSVQTNGGSSHSQTAWPHNLQLYIVYRHLQLLLLLQHLVLLLFITCSRPHHTIPDFISPLSPPTLIDTDRVSSEKRHEMTCSVARKCDAETIIYCKQFTTWLNYCVTADFSDSRSIIRPFIQTPRENVFCVIAHSSHRMSRQKQKANTPGRKIKESLKENIRNLRHRHVSFILESASQAANNFCVLVYTVLYFGWSVTYCMPLFTFYSSLHLIFCC